MGGEGSIASMIASIKNNRRKRKSQVFDKDRYSNTKKGTPIISKKFTKIEKDKFLKELHYKQEKENKLRIYKLILTFIITILVISGITFSIKLIYF